MKIIEKYSILKAQDENIGNDKHDEISSRICHECQFYSQSENANVKYMAI